MSPSSFSSVLSPSENVWRDGTGPNQSGNLLNSNPKIHDRALQYVSSVLLVWGVCGFSSEVDEQLIELVRKCEEIYDMPNK